MAVINLDPQLGRDLISTVSDLCDGIVNEMAAKAFEHVQLLGQNATTAEFEEKFMNFQSQYNGKIFPAFTTVQDTFKEHTNYAELQEQMKIDQSVSTAASGMQAAEGLGAVRQQLASATDLIS